MNFSKAPIEKKLIDFKFPKFKFEALSKDLDVYIINEKQLPLIRIKAILNVGAVRESKEGLAYFTSQMLKRGTSSRTSKQIAEKIDSIGASLHCTSQWDFTSMNILSLAEFIEDSFEILSDCLFNPTFDFEEVEKFKKKHIADLEQEHSDPAYLCNLAFNSTLFGEHPYGHIKLGTKESIESITPKDCFDWHNQLFSNEKMKLIILGDLNSDYVNKLIEKHFINRLSLSPKEFIFPTIKENSSKIIITDKPNINQTTLRIGKLTLDISHPDFLTFQFINTVFGGFFLSRLNNILREELGYTYGVTSLVQLRKYANTQIIATSVNKESTVDSIRRIFAELSKISKEAISDDEINLTKKFILGAFVRSIETTPQISALLENMLLHDLPLSYYDDFYAHIVSLQSQDVFEIQKKYFSADNYLIAATGDEEFLSKALLGFEGLED